VLSCVRDSPSVLTLLFFFPLLIGLFSLLIYERITRGGVRGLVPGHKADPHNAYDRSSRVLASLFFRLISLP
jgi:hypothetical protein